MIHLSAGLGVSYICMDFCPKPPSELHPHLLNRSYANSCTWKRSNPVWQQGSKSAICPYWEPYPMLSHAPGSDADGKFKQDRGNRANIRTFNDTNNTAFTTVSLFINQHCIEFHGKSHCQYRRSTQCSLKQEPVLSEQADPSVGNYLNGSGIDVK